MSVNTDNYCIRFIFRNDRVLCGGPQEQSTARVLNRTNKLGCTTCGTIILLCFFLISVGFWKRFMGIRFMRPYSQHFNLNVNNLLGLFFKGIRPCLVLVGSVVATSGVQRLDNMTSTVIPGLILAVIYNIETT